MITCYRIITEFDVEHRIEFINLLCRFVYNEKIYFSHEKKKDDNKWLHPFHFDCPMAKTPEDETDLSVYCIPMITTQKTYLHKKYNQYGFKSIVVLEITAQKNPVTKAFIDFFTQSINKESWKSI